MSDIVDLANERIEHAMDRLLRTKRYSALVPTGQCFNCGETVRHGHLFCDTECRDDYDRAAVIRRRQGL